MLSARYATDDEIDALAALSDEIIEQSRQLSSLKMLREKMYKTIRKRAQYKKKPSAYSRLTEIVEAESKGKT